jgi:hypothetical protein
LLNGGWGWDVYHVFYLDIWYENERRGKQVLINSREDLPFVITMKSVS